MAEEITFVPRDDLGLLADLQRENAKSAPPPDPPDAAKTETKAPGLPQAEAPNKEVRGLDLPKPTEDRFFTREDGTQVQTWKDGRVQILPPGGDWQDGTPADAAGAPKNVADTPKAAATPPAQQGGTSSATGTVVPPRQQQTGSNIPPDYMASVRAAESGGNDAAKSSVSSATGRYQFTKGTWNGLMRNHPELGLTPEGRLDPAQQERAMLKFTRNNADVLERNGIAVNGGSLYGAHFLGAGGAVKVYTANPSAPMSSLVGSDVIRANPFLSGMSAGDFQAFAAKKGGGGGSMRPPSEGTQAEIAARKQAASAATGDATEKAGTGQADTEKTGKFGWKDAAGLLANPGKSSQAPGLSAAPSRPQGPSLNTLATMDADVAAEIANIDGQIAAAQQTAWRDPGAAAQLAALQQRRNSLSVMG